MYQSLLISHANRKGRIMVGMIVKTILMPDVIIIFVTSLILLKFK